MTSRAGMCFLPIFPVTISLHQDWKAEGDASCSSARYNTKSQMGRFAWARSTPGCWAPRPIIITASVLYNQRWLLGWPQRPPQALCWTQQSVCHYKDRTYSINNSHKTLWEEVSLCSEGDLNTYYVPASPCQAHHPGGSSSYSRLQMESFMGI